MNSIPFVQIYFYDTSAIIKYLLNEEGSQKVRALFREGINHTSWVLLAECFGVLKRRRQKHEINNDQYIGAINYIFFLIKTNELRPVDLSIVSGQPTLGTYEESLPQILLKYPKIDAADALQLLAIRESFLRIFSGGSTPQLVTADKDLFKVALQERMKAVYVGNEDE